MNGVYQSPEIYPYFEETISKRDITKTKTTIVIRIPRFHAGDRVHVHSCTVLQSSRWHGLHSWLHWLRAEIFVGFFLGIMLTFFQILLMPTLAVIM